MMKRYLSLIFVTLFFISTCQLMADDIIAVNSQSSRSIVLTISFPEAELQSVNMNKDGESSTLLSMKGLPFLQEEGYPRVPYLNKMFSLPAKTVSYKILKINSTTVEVDNYALNIKKVNDQTFSGNAIIKNKNRVETAYHGLFRDVPIFSLTVFPVKLDPSGKSAEVITSITIECTTAGIATSANFITSNPSQKEKAVLSKLFVNGDNITFKLADPLVKAVDQYWPYKNNQYKILVDQTGLYKITHADLVDGEVPVEQFDTRKLRLMNKGKEIPIYFKGGEDGIFDPGDYFEFWGEKNEKTFVDQHQDVYQDPFSDINVYWLGTSASSGLRMAQESGALTITNPSKYIVPFAYTEKLHFEENKSFIRFGQANTDSLGHTMDHWFYDRGVTAQEKKPYTAFLPWPYTKISTRTVFVKAMMRGLSVWSKANPLENHLVEIWLNTKPVANSGEWKNQNAHIITNEGRTGLSQTDIVHGENELFIEMDQTGVTDIALLNWFEISYERQYRAYENFIRFRKQNNLPEGFTLQFEVDGFKQQDIEVYKLGVSKIVNGRIDYYSDDDNFSSYRISFQDQIFYPDIKYIALTSDQKKKPLDIVADGPWQPELENVSLMDVDNAADYLIITHDLFYLNALELKTYREGFGLKVAVVRVEDIYDEFNYGIKSPLAISDFLRYAYNNWDPSHRLLYVNLVGDASYNYRSNTDYVPTFLFDTEKYGAAASDHQYSLVSGDDRTPDLIIGRWPVSNNAEFEAYFNKLKAYEEPSNIGEWRNRGLFISGNDAGTFEQFTGLPAFRAQNQRLINMNTPEGYFTRKLNTVKDPTIPGGDPNFGSTPTLIDYIDEGLSLINFLGHGGGGIWADVGLFNTNDIDRLNNGSRLPFIKSMTCFTGAFESASISGIAEELIVTPDKGAIGVFAASGVGWLHNDFAVGWTLTNFLLEQDLTVGEAILYTKIFYLNNNLYVTEAYDTTIPSYYNLKNSMVHHYNLLGDPYVKITVPQENLQLIVDNTIPSLGDTITIRIEAPFTSGTGRVELTDEKQEPLDEAYLVISNNKAEATFIIPQELENQRGFIKAYAINSGGDADGRGLARIAINKALLDSLVISPATPSIGDEIYFSAHITSPVRIQRVRIKSLRGPTGQYLTLELAEESESVWRTTEPVGPYLFADTTYFDVQVDDTTDATYLSRRHQLIIRDPRPDLKIAAKSFKFGGLEKIELSLSVENSSDSLLSPINIGFYMDSVSSQNPPFREENLSFNPRETKTITFPVDPTSFGVGREFYTVVDAAFAIEERNETNNFAMVQSPDHLYNLAKNIGTSQDGVSNDTININMSTRYYLPAQGISASTVLEYREVTNKSLFESDLQPGLKYMPPPGQTEPMGVTLFFKNPATVQNADAWLEFVVDTSLYEADYLENVFICRYLANLSRWLAINSIHAGNKIYSTISENGTFALFHVSDSKEPVIEITVNGRILHNDMLVPRNPSLAFILQDENGIDLSTGFYVYIDDELLSEEDLNVPDTVQNANAISLVAKPELSSGEHNLRVEVTDAFGNRVEKILDFKVAEGFDIEIYGNYPNPFQEMTVFSFLIIANDILDEFSISIYTVSGRKIREIKRPQGADEIWDPGYHEIEWDGRDQDGALVANGVYFALVKADLKGKLFEQTMKVARLR